MKRDPPELKAVFFGEIAIQQQYHETNKVFASLLLLHADDADLDDTLVLTGEADLKAYGDVADHAQRRFPNVQAPLCPRCSRHGMHIGEM